jgi:uncharacterized protein YrzB (UPF0473 family)
MPINCGINKYFIQTVKDENGNEIDWKALFEIDSDGMFSITDTSKVIYKYRVYVAYEI